MQRIVVYQVLPRLFGNDSVAHIPHGTKEQNGCGRLADFTSQALNEIRLLGATHVWYTGIIEHATKTTYPDAGISADHPAVVKGCAGSPYAVKDYYDVDPDLAVEVENRRAEFRQLIDRTHKAGLHVLMDFVPNHVARHYTSDAAPSGVEDFGSRDDATVDFSPQNNFYYVPGEPWQPSFDVGDYREMPARATGNDVFHAHPSHNDWYETVKLNYGVDYLSGTTHFHPVPDTWNRMLQILLYWAEQGVDGFRCDMAEMVPVEFWEWAIPQVKARFATMLFIAEVYNPSEYRNYVQRGSFDYLYDKVGMYDTLRSVVCHQNSVHAITQCWQAVNDIRDHMLYFLENHDEQRLASDFFAGDARRGRPAVAVAALLHVNPFLLYFGQELGERGMDEEGFSGRDGRTTIFDYWSVDTVRRWRNGGTFEGGLTEDESQLREFYRRTLTLCNENDVLREGSSFDLMYVNPQLQRQYAFLRQWNGQCVLVVANFDDAPCQVDVHVPQHLFDFYGLTPQADIRAYNLYGAEKLHVPFTPEQPVPVCVPANYVTALQIKCNK